MASPLRVARLSLLAAVVVLVLSPGGAWAQRAQAPRARAGRAQQGRARARARADKRVFVLVGMPGAGKSTAAGRLADTLGASTVSTGDFIRSVRQARGLPNTRQNNQAVAQEFARKPGFLGRKAAAEVAADPGAAVVVEGFRAVADLDAFLRVYPRATVISVEIGAERRHQRMLKRGRVGEDSLADLRDRDRDEVRRGVREVMRRATVHIRPRGDSFESLDRSLGRVLSRTR